MFWDDYVWWLVFKGRDGCQRISDVFNKYVIMCIESLSIINFTVFVFYHTQIYTSSHNHGSFVMTETPKGNRAEQKEREREHSLST